MNCQGIDFTQSIPKVTGKYFVLTETPRPRDDEFYCTPTLVKLYAGNQTTWIQHSQFKYAKEIYPKDWHPIAENCGWWFSQPIEQINFKDS